jgi:hypothetical protein
MAEQNNRFSRFVADLALDPDKLADYMKDPEAAMQAAGLDDEEKDVLRTGDFRVICEFLLPAVEKPAPNDFEIGPGGI